MTREMMVSAGRHNYPVVIAAKIRHQVGEWLEQLQVGRDAQVFVITDETVAGIGYASDIDRSIRASGYKTAHAAVPPGDGSKSLETAQQLYNDLLDAGVRRNGVILALGGGVIGDLAGFVAATYQRGIRFVQIPTTLLAHDSSIGGKVGVNLPRGKNLVGAFYPPLAVLYDTSVLASLPVREWRAGMAEVIKHAIIGDNDLFERLEARPLAVCPDLQLLDSLLSSAIAVKKSVIEADEREQNLRMVLNLGHTIGHAVEQYSQYQLSHGQAVAIGIAIEAKIAVHRGLLNEKDWRRIVELLKAHELPIYAPGYPFDALAEIMYLDKKHSSAAAWTFVLPESIGRVSIHRDVTRLEAQRAYDDMMKETSP